MKISDKNMKNKFKGFTLIELLVVIAIIGILAGLVITSMGGARTSAHDTRVKSDLDQVRAMAEIYRINNSDSYATLSDNTEVIKLLTDCSSHDDTSTNTCSVTSNATLWCSNAQLQGTGNWCLDSSGKVGDHTCTNFACS